MIHLLTRHVRWKIDQRIRNRRASGRKGYIPMTTTTIPQRLEELRAAIRAENISYGEIAELQGLAEHIDPSDVELLEWAGVPEFPEEPPQEGDLVRLTFPPAIQQNGGAGPHRIKEIDSKDGRTTYTLDNGHWIYADESEPA